jgi:hypothetical protein
MTKPFTYIKGASLDDVLALAIRADAGSKTRDYEFLAEHKRVWLVRELDTDRSIRFVECFEFEESDRGCWGFRGWSEEEDIPHADCPLELLCIANAAVNLTWRKSVYTLQGGRYAMPIGAWLHCHSGIILPDHCEAHDFQFVGGRNFRCARGREWRFPPKLVARMLSEGGGIAMGRA